MTNKEIRSEYKKGNSKFFLRENNGTYFLEKITKACGYTVKCGSETEITNYINENGYKFVGLVVVR